MALKRWSNEEIEYISEKYGTRSIESIAKKLNRSVISVENKIFRLGLGGSRQYREEITIKQLADNCCVTPYRVRKWLEEGLKFISVKTRYKTYKLIKIDDFWDFAYKRRNEIDFTRIELNIFGKEPEWMKETRRIGKKDKFRKPYEEWEINILKRLYKVNTVKELSKMLDRSEASVTSQLRKLGLRKIVMLKWQEEEIELLKKLRGKGLTFGEIGTEMGRPAGSVWLKSKELEITC